MTEENLYIQISLNMPYVPETDRSAGTKVTKPLHLAIYLVITIVSQPKLVLFLALRGLHV